MKRLILILALLAEALCAKAQSNQTTYLVDTLSYQQLRAEIVTMNNQIIKFRENELVSVGLGFGAAGFATAGAIMSYKHPGSGNGLFICAGVMGVTSLVWYVAGYAGLRRDRLEITPNGMVIKIKEKKKATKPY